MTTFQDQPWSRRVMRDDAEHDGPHETPLSPGGGGGEPLDYMTQQRPGQGDADSFRARRAADTHDDELPSTQQLPAQETPRYRVRDYSPEGRSTPSWAPTYTRTPDPYATGERLDYRTQQRPEGAAVPSASAEGAGEARPLSPSGMPDPVITQTMTRRELRRLREEQEAASATAGSPPIAPPPEAPAEPASEVEEAAVEDAVDEAAVEETAVEETGHAAEDAAASPAPAAPWAPARFHGATGADQSEVSVPEPPAEPASEVEEAAVEETSVEETPVEEAPVEEAPIAEPPAAVRPDFSAPGMDPVEPITAPSIFAAPPASEPWRDAPPPVVDDAAEPEATAGQAGDDAPAAPDDLDAWVAQVFDAEAASVIRPVEAEPEPEPEQHVGASPVALVEPPEPTRWNPDEGSAGAGAPSVLESLFTPPAAAERAEAVPAPDPFSALAGPSASQRVDLPAPPGAETAAEPVDDADATPADVAEDAPEAEAADVAESTDDHVELAPPADQEIVVEPEDQEPAAADAEPHPIVIPAEPLPAEPLPPLEPTSGHWTEQAARDDDDGIVASRDIIGGHGVITTNALVLPAIPQPDLVGPLTTTGEILITGSIDLPMSLSATGAHPAQLDQSHLDHELDPGDQQVVSTESQPVRAIKAVSTHTSTRGMMTNTKPRGNRNLTILIAVTGGLAVVVAGLLIVGVLTHAFG